ncbi:DNA polymerase III subunit gamma/tau [Maridesulfovibrio hydrothermalis]|uniref:DNA polymerase III subunit gamma/tau n=1 Tax=Maridesulfovibrio hydrothermalis AM13 = DSM 14728 TaxID=1121451 RepID=L0RF55_9BACT|nr:DNA polymerase III subunit gamma/tau [Maridesulfovibrio hydrothermalis]CCO24842.1 DNA polymerase III, subunits gamma and tau [Maridesulfovibrio hydrothermalis AM13 = DSM 14728]
MSTSNLTAKYRPQTFGEVAGQGAVKTILSRAAAQDKIAPAYLFSGTRGVGKTTIARIFAKALNCKNAPTAEPCNECENCRQITAGVGVDVVEIDAASHGKVDDARRLKEDIGYAPIEFRYKVFIIDEAHMLTTQAFNALLKTLEEPPPHATFIMATTETHKFPATIISRCQHYAFKMLSSAELVAHLTNILQMEKIEFESGAIDLIAKRGAGSVRDSMSLLGQVLALGSDKLLEEDVRSILGLAGRDVFFALMQAIHERDFVSVGEVVKQVLDRGLDLGFFIRELGTCWRNMFLLGQSGERAIPLLDLSAEEAKEFMHWAKTFDRSFVHACWQMTVDGQRKVMTSLEPAMALELLLLNMASLTDLISVERAGALAASASQSAPAAPLKSTPPSTAPDTSPKGAYGTPPVNSASPAGRMPQNGQTPPPSEAPPWQSNGQQQSMPDHGRKQGMQSGGQPQGSMQQQSMMQGHAPAASNRPLGRSESGSPAGSRAATETGSDDSSLPDDAGRKSNNNFESSAHESENPAPVEAEFSEPAESVSSVSGPRNFEGFLQYMADSGVGGSVSGLNKCAGELKDGNLVLICNNPFHESQVSGRECRGLIARKVVEYFGPGTGLEITVSSKGKRKSRQQLRDEVEAHPDVKRVIEAFSASIISVEPRKDI